MASPCRIRRPLHEALRGLLSVGTAQNISLDVRKRDKLSPTALMAKPPKEDNKYRLGDPAEYLEH